MQESVSMHKSPTPLRHSRMNQTRSKEEKKKERGQEADGKKGSPTKQNTSEELHHFSVNLKNFAIKFKNFVIQIKKMFRI